jgi:lysozyme family protein
MKENFVDALARVLKHEGGYVNHPADPGGMTNLGVTKAVWEEWVGRESNEKEMRSLTPEIVAPLYRRKYWDKVQGDNLPDGVDYAVFDFAVNSGPGRAAKFLQELVGVKADGAIGPMTLTAVGKKNPKELIAAYNAKRQAFLESLPTFATFGKGWSTRVASVKNEAIAMTA